MTTPRKKPATPLTDFTACIAALDKAGNLIRVHSEVDLRFELAGIARKLEGTRPVLFECVKGCAFPVVAGLL